MDMPVSSVRKAKERQYELRRELLLRTARSDFWVFCKVMAPDFYIEGREHLKVLCQTLQAFWLGELLKPGSKWIDGPGTTGIRGGRIKVLVDANGLLTKPYSKLMINMPPRMGKTRTLVLFCQWLLGRDNTNKILAASYNDDVASDFSRFTRDGIEAAKNVAYDIVYSDVFPGTRIKSGNRSFEKWALEGQFFSYKGSGVHGAITGKGGSLLLADDLVKDKETAFSDVAMDGIWDWYTGTFLSRKEEGAKEIMNMTRWRDNDPCGRILEGEDAHNWYCLVMEAMNEDTGELLCPELMSKESYDDRKATMDPFIFEANFHQRTFDEKGAMYKNLREYDEVPRDKDGNELFERVLNYTDSADEGDDYLVSVIVGEYLGEGYVLDVYMTQEGMEITEPATAWFLVKNGVTFARFESNNGGKGFARAIQVYMRNQIEDEVQRVKNDQDKFTEDDKVWYNVPIVWFHQSENKKARILSSSNFIMQHMLFPKGWGERKDKSWKEFYRSITKYMREGENRHDDGPDALTGIAEMIQKPRAKARSIG
jgi:hypothetical protein